MDPADAGRAPAPERRWAQSEEGAVCMCGHVGWKSKVVGGLRHPMPKACLAEEERGREAANMVSETRGVPKAPCVEARESTAAHLFEGKSSYKSGSCGPRANDIFHDGRKIAVSALRCMRAPRVFRGSGQSAVE